MSKYFPGLRPDRKAQPRSQSPTMLLMPTRSWPSNLFRDTGQDSCGNQGGGHPEAEAALVSKIKAKYCGEVGDRREGSSEGVARARLGAAGLRSAQS